MMHIAYLTPEYPHKFSSASGGLGTSIKNMAETLLAKGVEVSIIVYGQGEDKIFQEGGIHFFFIKEQKYPLGGWYFYRKYLERKIRNIIRKEKVDILEAPDWTGITSFMDYDIPLVIRMNGTDAYFCAMENRKQKSKNRFFERTALKNADKIISVSDYTGRKTLEVLNLQRNYEVIPNSISLQDFQASQAIPEAGRILYFGTIIRKKGVLELAHIFNKIVKQHREAKLIFAGRDVIDIFDHISTLKLFKEKLSTEAKKQFEYVGALDYPMVRKEIEKANVVVLPSYAEALPMTWIEAMAMEKALVTSDIGWAPEVMVEGKTGFTVNPKNHELYASRILHLLNDRELSKKMGREARKQVVEKFSSEVVAKMNIHFYTETIENWRNR